MENAKCKTKSHPATHLVTLSLSIPRLQRPARVGDQHPLSGTVTPADRKSQSVRVTTVRHAQLNRNPAQETCGQTWGGVGDPRPALESVRNLELVQFQIRIHHGVGHDQLSVESFHVVLYRTNRSQIVHSKRHVRELEPSRLVGRCDGHGMPD